MILYLIYYLFDLDVSPEFKCFHSHLTRLVSENFFGNILITVRHRLVKQDHLLLLLIHMFS